MSKQSLLESAPEPVEQFRHNLSLAATARSESQRRDALAYLTGQLSQRPPFDPVGTQALLEKLLPLVSDRAGPVRSQLLKLFRALPAAQVAPHVEKAVLYVCAGMTNLSRDVNADSLAVMEWLLEAAGPAVVAAPGGWVRPLKTFCAVLGCAVTVAAAATTTTTTRRPWRTAECPRDPVARHATWAAYVRDRKQVALVCCGGVCLRLC